MPRLVLDPQPNVWLAPKIEWDDEEIAERGSDDDHPYGAWTKGGGRAATTAKQGAAIAHRLTHDAATKGGASVRLDSKEPVSGFMVGGEHTLVVDPASREQAVAQIKAWAAQNLAAVKADNQKYLGAWVEDGKLWLDVSTNIQKRAVADKLGKLRGEQAIFDVGRSESISFAEVLAELDRLYRHVTTEEELDAFIEEILELLDSVEIKERGSDDDHFYGAWSKGGGRAGPTSAGGAAALAKKRPGMSDRQAAVAAQKAYEKKLAGAVVEAEPVTEAYMDKVFDEDWRNSEAVGKAGIRRYSQDRYVDLNTYLRTGKPPSYVTYEGAEDFIKRDISSFRAAMKPLPKPIKVYRGVDSDVFGIKEDYSSTAVKMAPSELVGRTFTDKGFMSTSIDEAQTMGGVQMRINVPKGTKGIWAKPFSADPGEQELILQSGLKYRVTDAYLDTHVWESGAYEARFIDVDIVP